MGPQSISRAVPRTVARDALTPTAQRRQFYVRTTNIQSGIVIFARPANARLSRDDAKRRPRPCVIGVDLDCVTGPELGSQAQIVDEVHLVHGRLIAGSRGGHGKAAAAVAFRP